MRYTSLMRQMQVTEADCQGELLPYQGGTNEMVAAYMYEHLTEQEKPLLKIYWYTGKDQMTPLNAKDKSRNCHVKLLSTSALMPFLLAQYHTTVAPLESC